MDAEVIWRRQFGVGWWVVPPLIGAALAGLAFAAGSPQLAQLVVVLAGVPLVAVVGLGVRLTGVRLQPNPVVGAVVMAVLVVANWYMLAVIARAVRRVVGNVRAARQADDPDA